jgi:hypothetical protein
MKEITDADGDVVDVAYNAMNGEIRVMPWTDVDPLAVADGRPWREFPWYLGQLCGPLAADGEVLALAVWNDILNDVGVSASCRQCFDALRARWSRDAVASFVDTSGYP